MSESSCILVDSRPGVVRITLNRPDKLNSFNEAMHLELIAAIRAADADASVRCLILTGAGRGFCAGQDLGARKAEDPAQKSVIGQSLEKLYNPLVKTLRGLRMPVICAVNGVAAGAGANVALACDIVIAAGSARFIQAFSKIGLIPDAGGTWALPRLVGQARATALAMLAEPVGAEQAEQWGMIWRCVDDQELEDHVWQMAEHLATQPTQAMALIKQAMMASATNTLAQQLDVERDLQAMASESNDFREGVSAFLAKREPKFNGN
ncbi:MAG: 2-(1,2-epoxy-1,2-dihydrophenyl)acetyl-CoA isomerase PaaG [Chromatiales bacterium]|nr:2-(1,2-epoxy-1,2-dihydrophenyl)acetyl-CoA isomerase PaaG [Chromatiales bacterium]